MAPKSILVVDDDPLIGDLLREFLNSYARRVEFARNGETALQLHAKSPYDLIITDFHMPGTNGLELAQRIRRRSPHQPIIMITGHPAPVSVPREHLPLNAVLRKPFSLQELEAAMLEIFPADQNP